MWKRTSEPVSSQSMVGDGRTQQKSVSESNSALLPDLTAAPNSASASASASVADAESVLTHLSQVFASTNESYHTKLALLNTIYVHLDEYDSTAHRAALAEYFQFYPDLLLDSNQIHQATNQNNNNENQQQQQTSSESDEMLLQSCVNALRTFFLVLCDSCEGADESSDASVVLLNACHRLVRFLLHPHAFISEFFAQLWIILHAELNQSFQDWSVDVMLQLLLASGQKPSDDQSSQTDHIHTPSPTPANRQSQSSIQFRQQWFVNRAQRVLIELLAQMTATLSVDNQKLLFKHFNLLLQPSSAPFSVCAIDHSHQLPLAVQSALLISMDWDSLQLDIQQVLFGQTLFCCLAELRDYQSQPFMTQLIRLPVLVMVLEIIYAGFKPSASASSTASANASSAGSSPASSQPTSTNQHLRTLAPQIASTLHAIVTSLTSTFITQSDCQPNVDCISATFRAIFLVLTCDEIARCLTWQSWTQLLSEVRRLCEVPTAPVSTTTTNSSGLPLPSTPSPTPMLSASSVGSASSQSQTQSQHTGSPDRRVLRELFGDILLGIGWIRPSTPEACDSFFANTLQPSFKCLFNAINLSQIASSGSSTPSPTTTYSSTEVLVYESFFRFSTTAHSGWSARMKELIPAEHHKRLIAYIRLRGRGASKREAPHLRRDMLFERQTSLSQSKSDLLQARLDSLRKESEDDSNVIQQTVLDAVATARREKVLRQMHPSTEWFRKQVLISQAQAPDQ